MSEEAALRARIDTWTAALEARDLDAMTALCADDIAVYDVKFTLRGVAAYRDLWTRCFPMLPEKFRLERKDMEFGIGADTAFMHCRTAMVPDGGTAQAWLRVTVCYRKQNGAWRATHEHASVPFDFGTMQASFADNDWPPRHG